MQVILSSGTVLAAALVAVVIGSRKGLADAEARSDAEMAKLVSALEGRVRVLTEDLDSANKQISALRAEVASLRQELADERRITARLAPGRRDQK